MRGGNGSILMPGGGLPQAAQLQPPILMPMNDAQILALMAAFQPVNLTAPEAVARCAEILAYSVLANQQGGLLQQILRKITQEVQSGA